MERVILSQKSYAAAYRCTDCPQSNQAEGCPKWIELIETNTVTQQERMTCGCVDQLFPNIAVELIKAANRPAAEISAMRDQVASTMERATMQAIQGIHRARDVTPAKVSLFGRLRLALGGAA